MLDGEEMNVTGALATDNYSYEDLADQLLVDETRICWTCGGKVDTDRIEETLDTLRTVG
ncbi:hypothetical protein [Natrinema sp. DC36]|uniref:hypothetical protein n=1 Tax=Natrinema sp. DC36 TaxID=2878680 RepID=UPI001CF0B3C6|nr:hypothetical protein [Natrinema sp. DC36]